MTCACSRSTHYLNPHGCIVNWGRFFKFKSTYKISFYENALEIVTYKSWYCSGVVVTKPISHVPIFAKMQHLGERQEAQILKFNAPPTHLVCHVHLIATFLSFHTSLVVVVNCGAGNALRGFEISMFYFFLNRYFIHISKGILLLRAQNALKQCKWYFSRKP